MLGVIYRCHFSPWWDQFDREGEFALAEHSHGVARMVVSASVLHLYNLCHMQTQMDTMISHNGLT
jgi:hypothetical protein